jgi:hypothetical protein
MAYKIKKSKPRDYSEEEILRLKKKYPHEILPFSETLRVGLRKVSDVPQRVHKKGAMVQYKERLAKVHKVTKKGLWIETFKKEDDGFMESTGKIIFIPENRVEHEVYPMTTRLPVMEGLTIAV